MKIETPIDVGKYRGLAYDKVGDQLDRITKALAHLAEQGVDIGIDGLEQVDHSRQVKALLPKKST